MKAVGIINICCAKSRKLSRGIWTLILIVIGLLSSGCVHEFPVPCVEDPAPVTLLITHKLDWTELNHNLTLARASQNVKARYVYKIFEKGTVSSNGNRVLTPVYEIVDERDDLSFSDFTKNISLPVGDWEIYIWQELVCTHRESRFYNIDNFPNITYNLPYEGNTDLRDAFEGYVSVSVKDPNIKETEVTAVVEMERPFAKYVFVATDFEDFMVEMLRREGIPEVQNWEQMTLLQQKDVLQKYKVVALYPYFMPANYNMVSAMVTDSWTGITYQSEIVPVNSKEAYIAMDHVMVNHAETACQVQLGLMAPDGKITAMTGTISVPLKRSRVTYVRGKLLTNNMGAGIDIDFDFSGDFNIKL